MWVSERDKTLISHLGSRGFLCDDYYMDYRQQTLEGPLENPRLPPGYAITAVKKREADNRTAVAHAAFESSKGIDAYTENYQQFMDSPIYDPEMDLVVVDPVRCFATFCICWVEKDTGFGYIEPFGTSSVYHRRGLGKALLRAALENVRNENSEHLRRIG
jgi:ribosomal protein S18 acetylase RimI-like enzyme